MGLEQRGRVRRLHERNNWKQEDLDACDKLPDGSRVRRELYARFCERLGVRLPGPTHPHICGTNYRTGKFTIHRQTVGKRMAAKLKEIRVQLRKRMHARIPGTVKWLQQVVRGFFQYHAVPGNGARMGAFRNEVLRSWLWALRRRSQRQRMTWERLKARLEPLLPPVQVLHPYPDARFAAKYPNILGRNRVR